MPCVTPDGDDSPKWVATLAARKHAFFERNGIDTDALLSYGVEPPFVPTIASATDSSNFDNFEDEADAFPASPVDTSGFFDEFADFTNPVEMS